MWCTAATANGSSCSAPPAHPAFKKPRRKVDPHVSRPRELIFWHTEVDVTAREWDGYVAFPSIMTEATAAETLAALKWAQNRYDRVVTETD
eukprot:SAG11_NODE_3932_length_2143_cov_2.221624_1_plen_91_part_00